MLKQLWCWYRRYRSQPDVIDIQKLHQCSSQTFLEKINFNLSFLFTIFLFLIPYSDIRYNNLTSQTLVTLNNFVFIIHVTHRQMKQTVACVSQVFCCMLEFCTNLKVCSHASMFKLQNSGFLCGFTFCLHHLSAWFLKCIISTTIVRLARNFSAAVFCLLFTKRFKWHASS